MVVAILVRASVPVGAKPPDGGLEGEAGRGPPESGHDRSRPGEPRPASPCRVEKGERHSPWERAEHVAPFGAQPVRGTGEPTDDRLRATFREATPTEVRPGAPGRRGEVVDLGIRVVQEPPGAISTAKADAELGLLTPGGVGADPTEVRSVAACGQRFVPSDDHRSPEGVADLAQSFGHSLIGAAEDPVELPGEPGWTPLLPPRLDPTTRAEDVLVDEVGGEPTDPARSRDGIVVEEGDEWCRRGPQRRVASTRQALEVLVLQRSHLGELAAHALVQRRSVVDHHEDLARWGRLVEQRSDGIDHELPTLLGVGAHDGGHVVRVDRSRYRRRSIGCGGAGADPPGRSGQAAAHLRPLDACRGPGRLAFEPVAGAERGGEPQEMAQRLGAHGRIVLEPLRQHRHRSGSVGVDVLQQLALGAPMGVPQQRTGFVCDGQAIEQDSGEHVEVFAAEPDRAGPESDVEATQRHRGLPAHRHVVARSGRRGEREQQGGWVRHVEGETAACEAAAEPAVLLEPDLCLRLQLQGLGEAGHAGNPPVLEEGRGDVRDPTGIGDDVVVGEHHDLVAGGPESRVASLRRTGACLGQVAHPGVVAEALVDDRLRPRVVGAVVHDQDLEGIVVVLQHRVDARADQIESTARGDDHAHRGRRSSGEHGRADGSVSARRVEGEVRVDRVGELPLDHRGEVVRLARSRAQIDPHGAEGCALQPDQDQREPVGDPTVATSRVQSGQDAVEVDHERASGPKPGWGTGRGGAADEQGCGRGQGHAAMVAVVRAERIVSPSDPRYAHERGGDRCGYRGGFGPGHTGWASTMVDTPNRRTTGVSSSRGATVRTRSASGAGNQGTSMNNG